MLGSELWESKLDGLLSLVKEYSVDVWEILKLSYMIATLDLVNNSILSLRLGRGMVGLVRMVYKFGQNGKSSQNGNMHLGLNVYSGPSAWSTCRGRRGRHYNSWPG